MGNPMVALNSQLRPGGAAREELVSRAKVLLRPVRRYRPLLERARYANTAILSPELGNAQLQAMVGKSGAAAKLGASELGGVLQYLARRDSEGICSSWGRHRLILTRNAGVYPDDSATLSKFCGAYLEAGRHLDMLAVWFRPGERMVQRQFISHATLAELRSLEPYYHSEPWTRALEGKRVVVVSPFATSIEQQYRHRVDVWKAKPSVLPTFHLRTVRAPLSAALVRPVHADWFAALDALKAEMSQEPFDVAIIGAGAWSLPLVAHAKGQGALGVHLGGPTQILFGIAGRRWENNEAVAALVNDAWIRPSKDETPESARQIENACYW